MNCVQQTMISGSHRKGCLEWSADACITPPALMWRGKNVRVYEGAELTARYNSCTCFPPSSKASTGGGGAECCVYPLIAIGYILVSAVASPFLCVGGALKHLAFEIDPEAKEYNQLACDHLNELGDMSQIDKSLQEGCCYIPHGDSFEQTEIRRTALTNQITDLEKKLRKKDFLELAKEDIAQGQVICKHDKNQFSYVPIMEDGIVVDYNITTSSDSEMKLATTLNKWEALISSYEKEILSLQAQIDSIDTANQQYQTLSDSFITRVSRRESDSFI